MSAVPPWALVVTGIVSVQVGSGLAGRMFGEVSPATLTGLRLWTAAAAMAAFGGRGLARSVGGLVRERAWRDAAVVVAFGVTLAIMNLSFYQAIARIPLGIAVTIEFLGPLAVAVASSRRLVDLIWVALAGTGVALLSDGWSSLSLHGAHAGGGAGTALAGVAFALVAAAGWAAYILLSASTGRRFPGSSGLAIAMVVAAVAVTPAAVARLRRAGFPAAARRARHRDRGRAAVVGHPVPARDGDAAPDPGADLRHLDEPGARRRRAGRPGTARRGPRAARVGRDRLRDHGLRRGGARRRAAPRGDPVPRRSRLAPRGPGAARCGDYWTVPA